MHPTVNHARLPWRRFQGCLELTVPGYPQLLNSLTAVPCYHIYFPALYRGHPGLESHAFQMIPWSPGQVSCGTLGSLLLTVCCDGGAAAICWCPSRCPRGGRLMRLVWVLWLVVRCAKVVGNGFLPALATHDLAAGTPAVGIPEMSPPSDGSFPCGGAPGSCCHVVNAHRFRLMANPWMWFLSVVEELDLDVQAPFAGKFSYPRSGKCCARGACSQMLAFMLTAWVASRSGSGWRAVSPSCVMNSMVGHTQGANDLWMPACRSNSQIRRLATPTCQLLAKAVWRCLCCWYNPQVCGEVSLWFRWVAFAVGGLGRPWALFHGSAMGRTATHLLYIAESSFW